MRSFWLRRLLSTAWILFALTVLAFLLVRAVPGDTATALLGIRYSPEEAEVIRARYGLDQPLPVQYARWAARVVRGDLGTATTGRPVVEEIGDALAVTLELAALAFVFAVAIGVPLGVWAALRRGKTADVVAGVGGLLGLSIPGFWLGTLLILGFALWLGWFPSGGFVALAEDPVENLRHLLLPAIALGLAVAAVLIRMTRASLLELLGADHVRTARAKGLPPARVVIEHILRNALPPILTLGGLQAAWLLGGSVVIEEVFSLPGLGRLALDSIQRRDYATLQAVILLAGVVFTAMNLAVDLLHAWLDPRVREEVRGG